MKHVLWICADADEALLSIQDNLVDCRHHKAYIDSSDLGAENYNKFDLIVIIAEVANAELYLNFVGLLSGHSNVVKVLSTTSAITDRRKSPEELKKLLTAGFKIFNHNEFLLTMLDLDMAGMTEVSHETDLPDAHCSAMDAVIIDTFANTNRWYGELDLSITINREVMSANLRTVGFAVPNRSWEERFTFISAILDRATVQVVFEECESSSVIRQYLAAICEKLGACRTVNIYHSSKVLRDLMTDIDPESKLLSGITNSKRMHIDKKRVLIFYKPESI